MEVKDETGSLPKNQCEETNHAGVKCYLEKGHERFGHEGVDKSGAKHYWMTVPPMRFGPGLK